MAEPDKPSPEKEKKGKQLIQQSADLPTLSHADEVLLSVSFDLEEFDFHDTAETMLPDATYLYLGKRRTGKTVALMNNLDGMKESIESVIVMSSTETANGTYENVVLQDYIYLGYQELVVERVLDLMGKLRFLERMGRLDGTPYVCIILDDLITEKSFQYENSLLKLFVAGRHFYVNVHITSQYPKGIPPKVRQNSDYVFLFKAPNPECRRMFYEDYGLTMERKVFYAMLDEYTQGYGCLVVCNYHPEDDDLRQTFKHVTYPFPFPEPRFGGDEEWDKQEREMEDAASRVESYLLRRPTMPGAVMGVDVRDIPPHSSSARAQALAAQCRAGPPPGFGPSNWG